LEISDNVCPIPLSRHGERHRRAGNLPCRVFEIAIKTCAVPKPALQLQGLGISKPRRRGPAAYNTLEARPPPAIALIEVAHATAFAKESGSALAILRASHSGKDERDADRR
jgi:hypothetical protein